MPPSGELGGRTGDCACGDGAALGFTALASGDSTAFALVSALFHTCFNLPSIGSRGSRWEYPSPRKTAATMPTQKTTLPSPHQGRFVSRLGGTNEGGGQSFWCAAPGLSGWTGTEPGAATSRAGPAGETESGSCVVCCETVGLPGISAGDSGRLPLAIHSLIPARASSDSSRNWAPTSLPESPTRTNLARASIH